MFHRRPWPAARIALSLVALIASFSPLAGAAELQGSADQLIGAAKLGKSDYSILAVNLSTGEQLFADGADNPVAPASNMKLVTTASAMKILGPGFTFHTKLRLISPADWKSVPGAATKPESAANPSQGYVLVVQGDGDPSFGDPKMLEAAGSDAEKLLQEWVGTIKAAGVDKVDKIVVDDRVFDREMTNPHWPENQLLRWYCAQVSGVTFNDNCLDVYPQMAASGPVFRMVPNAPFLHVVSKAFINGPDTPINLGRKLGTNDFTITGRVHENYTTPLTVTLHDPAGFFGQVMANRLVDAGISVNLVVRPAYEDHLPEGKTLAAYESKLPDVIHRCNRDSQNLFAECLIKRIGQVASGQPGGWINGSAAIVKLLSDKLGAHANGVVVIDGSGMSRENRVTARAIVGLLHMMASDPKCAQPFRDSLAVAGIDGTLEKRFHDKLRGHFFGKTGYINGVSSLSGYIYVPTAKGDQIVAISMIFNGFGANGLSAVRKLQEELIEMSYDKLSG